MEKLDTLSKILLATQSINYMALQINTVNEHIKMIQNTNTALQKGIIQRDNKLYETERHLTKIMTALGDFMNANDICSNIDARVTSQAFSILQGNDNIE